MYRLSQLIFLAGCQNGTVYTIPAGQHSSTSSVSIHSGTFLDFRATFDDSAIYQSVDPVNQADINKLYGFSDCLSHHHHASARFGWRWYEESLQILAYTYANGVRDWAMLGEVDLNQSHHYRLEISGDQYLFTLDNGPAVVMDRGCDTVSAKYMLWPYFGGDETAPHDIQILVAETP